MGRFKGAVSVTLNQYIITALACAIAVWPAIARLIPTFRGSSGPTFQQAIANLAQVRVRLHETGLLGDEQKKSIDVLTLGLVEGSDK